MVSCLTVAVAVNPPCVWLSVILGSANLHQAIIAKCLTIMPQAHPMMLLASI